MHPIKLRLSTLITAVVAVAMLAVAIDWNAAPGVAEADHGEIDKPTQPTGISGDGTITFTWGSTHDADAGYEFRYAEGTAGRLSLLSGEGAPAWEAHGTNSGSTSLTIGNTAPDGDDPNPTEVGKTYYLQVRGKDTDDTVGEASDLSSGVLQRAAPVQLINVQVVAGNAQVTLSWGDPNDDTILSYDYRIDPDPSDGSSGWTLWQNFTSSTNSHTVSGLTNGTTYSFQVRANNSQGSQDEDLGFDTVTATPTGPPAAPGDLRATPQDTAVRLHWNDPNDSNIDLYQFRYKSDGDFNSWAEIPNSGATTTDHTVTSLSNSIEYTFEVRAIDSDRAEGDQAGLVSSATATPTTEARAPSQMSNVQRTVTGVTGGSGGQVRFTWDNPDDASIDKYQYRYSTTSSSDGFFNWADVSGSSATTTSYPTGTGTVPIPGSSATLFYEFRAVNDAADIDSTADVNEGGGPATAVRVDRSNTAGTSPSPPDAPANVSISTTSTTVTVAWDKPSVTTNIIWQRQQSHNGGPFGDWEMVTTAEASNRLSFVVSSASGTYAFKIRAVDNKGNTDDSDDVNGAVATTESATPGAPNAPTGLTATAKDVDTTTDVNEAETQVALVWSAGADITGVVVDDYEYRMRVGGTVSYGEWMSTGLASVPTADNPFTVIVKFPSTTYYFQVRAVAGALKSDPSNAASGTTANPPSGETIDLPAAPTGLRASAGDEQVTLNWSHPNTDEVKWYRYRQAEGDDASSGEWQQVPGTGATMTHTVTDLTNGTTYSFQVQAVGAGSMIGTASETVTAAPRPPPTGGGGTSVPQRDSVTAHNSDETIDVTIEKPASVTLDVAVVDQACNTGAPDGSVHLCVQANASGAVGSLATGPATMTIVISRDRWTQMEGAYNAEPRRFFLSKRSSTTAPWRNIAWCVDDSGRECYRLQETPQGGATMFVDNIVSFSQYAITTVGERTTATGGGVTTRPRRRARPTPTALPIPTVEATATPDTPTPPPNTPTPPVEPTPPPPANTPTPPATVPPPEPPSPLPPTEAPTGIAPTEAPTGEPVVQAPATEAPPPPTDAPEVTAVPPPVDTGGGFPGWLIIVIIVAVIGVAGLGYLAFRMFRQQ